MDSAGYYTGVGKKVKGKAVIPAHDPVVGGVKRGYTNPR
jgi:hypothetical protein